MFSIFKKWYNECGDNLKDSILYSIVRPIVKTCFKIIYRPKYIGLDNIPKYGSVILASNHKNNLDCIYLISSTKRPIHFLAKKELFTGFKKVIFNNMGLIPVDRGNSEKRHEALVNAIKYLNNNKVIGIFPEGTFNKSDKPILPFKMGSVKMSYETKSPIVPVIIKGEYKKFSKNLVIEFLKPIYISSDDFENENKKLENIFINELEE